MESWKIVLIIIWCIIGLMGVWREYFSTKKYWWESYNKVPDHINILLYSFVICTIGGPITFFIFEFMSPVRGSRVWYYKIPKK
jgi:hypothetical protein